METTTEDQHPEGFDLSLVLKQLESPPPRSDAGREAWSAWHRNNSMGAIDFWIAKEKAVQWRCPKSVPLVLIGVSHKHEMFLEADKPLSEALSAYCTSAPKDEPIDVSEVNVTDISSLETETPREIYNGYLPLKLQVVYKDPEKTRAAFGPIPNGYYAFSGSAYLLSENDKPWYLTLDEGIEMYNKVLKEAMMEYLEGGTDYKLFSYDPERAWFDMCDCLIQVLACTARKPRGGYSKATMKRALDKIMAIFILMARESDWTRDARGKIVLANPECRKKSVQVLRKMDECSAKIISATAPFVSEETPSTSSSASDGSAAATTVEFTLQDGLDQLKKFMINFQEEYPGFVQDGYDYKGYLPFSKALSLLG